MNPRAWSIFAGLVAATAIIGIAALFGPLTSWDHAGQVSLALVAFSLSSPFWLRVALGVHARTDTARIGLVGPLYVVSLSLIVVSMLALYLSRVGMSRTIVYALDIICVALFLICTAVAQIIMPIMEDASLDSVSVAPEASQESSTQLNLDRW